MPSLSTELWTHVLEAVEDPQILWLTIRRVSTSLQDASDRILRTKIIPRMGARIMIHCDLGDSEGRFIFDGCEVWADVGLDVAERIGDRFTLRTKASYLLSRNPLPLPPKNHRWKEINLKFRECEVIARLRTSHFEWQQNEEGITCAWTFDGKDIISSYVLAKYVSSRLESRITSFCARRQSDRVLGR